MKKQLLFIAVLSAVIFSSCKKDHQKEPPGSVDMSNRVKTRTSNTGYVGVTTFTYDASGRLIKESRPNGTWDEYEYLNGIVNQKSINAQGNIIYILKNELGPDGLEFKSTWSNDPGAYKAYEYNSNKQLVKFTSHSSGGEHYVSENFYTNGNCDSTRQYTDNVWNYTSIYTYYTDKPNNLDFQAYGKTYLGNASKNLLKSDHLIFSDGTTAEGFNRVYEFDSKGRAVKAVSTGNGNVYATTFTY